MEISGIIKQLTEERDRLNAAITALQGLSPAASRKGSPHKGRTKGTMSAAGRARIAAAQRARWAKVKKGK
jgi:hypothetical protein